MTKLLGLKLTSRRVNSGEYIVNDRYWVTQTADGWRWHDGQAPSVGGEWRRSKREALLDLDHHVNAASGIRAFWERKQAATQADIAAWATRN
jgi:hypothetical protein